MKKLLLLKLLVLVTCLSSALSATAYDLVIDGIYYNYVGQIGLEVTYKDTNYNSYSGSVSIPNIILMSNGIPYYVTSIGKNAFRNCSNLTSVTYADPGMPCTIGDYAFYNCTSLRSFTFPSYVSTIGDYAFYNSGLTSVTIPVTLSSLGSWAFAYCSNLTSAVFYTNSAIYEIPRSTFYHCTALNSLTIGGAVTKIGELAFYACTSLTEVVIPDQITTIDDYAFMDCGGMTKFTIGKSVTSIGSYALSFNGSVTMYGEDALRAVDIYSNAVNPPTITYSTFGSNYNSSNNFVNPYKRYTVYVHGPYEQSLYAAATYWSNFITTSTTNIRTLQNYDFYTGGIYYNISGSNTAMVVNKYGYNSICWFGLGDYSYRGDVTIPNTAYDSYTGKTYNVTAIGASAFCETPIMMLNNPAEAPSLRDQGDLKSVTIGNNVTTIEQEAFKDCSGLTTVTLGTGVTSIGNDAFKNCTSLTTIRSNRTTPPTIQSTTFDSNHYSNAKLYVPKSAINSYKAANYWKNFYLIVPNDGTELDYALNVEGGNIHFTTDSYPWTVAGDGTRVYARSFNIPYAAQSNMYANVNLTKESTLTFDYLAKLVANMGGIDLCYFYIDDEIKFVAQAVNSNWMSYSVDIPAGTHTLRWMFLNNSYASTITVNYFAVDNVKLVTQASVVTGDVNGDGSTTIADVTALIDSLLSGVEVPLDAADVNGDGSVTIADVTALIDMLLGS